MSKAKILQPDLVLGDIILHLTPDLIKQHNLKGLILDVDETLVPWREKKLSPELREWAQEIDQYTDVWLVSNNISENRIAAIASELNVPFLYGAGKPSRRKLKVAAKAMNHPLSQIAMVGDRLFTDVLAGNRLGLFTILVEPMVSADQDRFFSIRNFEVWLSQKLGVSLYNT